MYMKKNIYKYIYIYHIPIQYITYLYTQIVQVIYTDMHIQEVGKKGRKGDIDVEILV